MIELIIEAPHLQTLRQRLAARVLNLLGWLLWCYFFFPLAALGCGLLGHAECSQWVNLAGGYSSLKELLLAYAETVAAMTFAWVAWAAYNRAKRRRRPPLPVPQPVSRSELCRAFHVSERDLAKCQESRYAIVHFDSTGRITGLEQGRPDPDPSH